MRPPIGNIGKFQTSRDTLFWVH